tara:strand:+ start:7708 stop:8151 length:444 start_codon:yes stop_codon:yes gene_type:complete
MSWQDILKMKKPKHPFGRPPTPKEKAKQLILDTVEELPYARREGNKVILEPDWAKEQKSYYYFDTEDIHKNDMCVWVVNALHIGPPRKICLGRGSNLNSAIPADFYVTLIMLIGNESDFNKLWSRERGIHRDIRQPVVDYGEEDGEA